jgi:predicted RNA-binding protein (virulence factor B family)
MKKLISIKSDESGENIYFTHKNGVDSVRKDDVIDLELLNPSIFSMTRSDGYLKLYKQLFIFGITSYAVGNIENNSFFFFVPTMGIILIIFIFLVFLTLFSVRINTRNILKIYTKDKVMIFKIIENKDYQTIYLHFKNLLHKYFPKEGGELILYKNNSKLKTSLLYLMVSDLIIGGTLLYGIICYTIYSEIQYFQLFLLVFALTFSIILFILHRSELNDLKINAQYYFKGKFIEKKYNYYGDDDRENVLLNNIYQSIFIKNDDYIAVIPRDYKTENDDIKFESPSEYLKHWEGKNGGIFHKLIISEEFRDITPIMIEYLNDLSQNIIDVQFKKDREFVLEAVKTDENALLYTSDDFRKDKDIVLEAVKSRSGALQYADESLKKDKEFVLEMISNNSGAFEYADESLKKDREFVLEAVKNNGNALEYADESFKKDIEIVLEAVKNVFGNALEYVDESFKKDREIVLEAVKNGGYAFKFADESLKKDREFVLMAVKSDRIALHFADESLKKDREFVLEVVKSDGKALKYADESLKKDRKFVLEAVKSDGNALFGADESLKKDRDFILEAVKICGWALYYADESIKKDREIVLEAVKNNGHALQYADESIKKDREIVLEAVKNNGWALQYADESIKKDRKIVLEAVKNNGNALQYVDESLKKDKEIVLEAVKYFV